MTSESFGRNRMKTVRRPRQQRKPDYLLPAGRTGGGEGEIADISYEMNLRYVSQHPRFYSGKSRLSSDLSRPLNSVLNPVRRAPRMVRLCYGERTRHTSGRACYASHVTEYETWRGCRNLSLNAGYKSLQRSNRGFSSAGSGILAARLYLPKIRPEASTFGIGLQSMSLLCGRHVPIKVKIHPVRGSHESILVRSSPWTVPRK